MAEGKVDLMFFMPGIFPEQPLSGKSNRTPGLCHLLVCGLRYSKAITTGGHMQTQLFRVALAGLFLIGGCATTPKPVLYPNAHLKNVGDAAAQRDIGECTALAENSGLSKSSNQAIKSGTQGAATGAAAAAVGTLIRGGSVLEGAAAGAAVGGTAGAVSGAFRNDANPTYRNFVQRCLHDRGYDVIGWQ